MEEAYRQARKRGEQGRRRAISQSEHPYLTDLDSLVAQLPLGQRENVGLRDIPLEMVVGTVTKGRQSAFSCNFMPLLPFSTEFARKWSNLYDIQVTEGYRDPVIVTEFMHRFYVQEGNKRVSVLKFLDAPTVSAKVTRLYPGTWDSVESRLYGEFCAFWRVCPLYEIEFSREGSYETLAKMLGQDLIEKWPQKKVDYLRHTFLLFRRAYLRAGGDHLDITPADDHTDHLDCRNVFVQFFIEHQCHNFVLHRIFMWNCANAAQKLSYDIYITVSYHFFAPIARQNCFFVGVFFTTPLRAGISCQICAPSPAKSRSRSAYPRRTNSTPPRRLLPRAASAASASAAPPRRSGAVSFAPRSVPPGCTYNVRSATRTFAPSAAKPSAQAKRFSNTLSCRRLSPCA